ncbi:MAG: dTMP kinase [bacterium]
MTGKFITLEGIEGAGKSTSLKLIEQTIRNAGIELVVTREPGGTALGEALREILLSHQHTGMSDDAELLLMFAARAEHIASVIQPALDKGVWVLCDRFTDATFAYQGGGRGQSDSRITTIADWVQQGLHPDLTLLLDLPVATGLERAGNRSEPDRFEVERNGFFEQVRDKYLETARQEPGRVKVIDASQSLDNVSAQVVTTIQAFISGNE